MPAVVAGTLDRITEALRTSLGSNLVGVYVYGSLTQRAFDPARSDIDCLVVVRRDPTPSQIRRLRAWLARAARIDSWIRRLQMQILRRGTLLRTDARGYLYQLGALRRSGSDGNPIVWMNVLASGLTLAGARPATLLPPITRAMLTDALGREVGYLRTEITSPGSKWRRQGFYRAYAVLTLCRILYSHHTGRITSKPRAARWALRRLPSRWHSLVQAALAHDRGESPRLLLPAIASLIQLVEDRLASTEQASRRTHA